MSRKQQSTNPIRRCISGALALLVLVFSLASASPDLHHWLHGNTDCAHANTQQVDSTPAPADQGNCEQACDGHHQEDGAQSHQDCSNLCPVNMLHQGVTTTVIFEPPPRIDAVLENLAIESESHWCGQAPIRLSARAPPTVSVV
jgi:hypothetical protein